MKKKKTWAIVLACALVGLVIFSLEVWKKKQEHDFFTPVQAEGVELVPVENLSAWGKFINYEKLLPQPLEAEEATTWLEETKVREQEEVNRVVNIEIPHSLKEKFPFLVEVEEKGTFYPLDDSLSVPRANLLQHHAYPFLQHDRDSIMAESVEVELLGFWLYQDQIYLQIGVENLFGEGNEGVLDKLTSGIGPWKSIFDFYNTIDSPGYRTDFFINKMVIDQRDNHCSAVLFGDFFPAAPLEQHLQYAFQAET